VARGKCLFVGESWIIETKHIKGVDAFMQFGYGEGVEWVRRALEESDIEVIHMPAHLAIKQFPTELSKLQEYDVIIFSDIGANTFLLHPDVTTTSTPTPNRLALVEKYVALGGAFVMIGGYLTFQGIDAKGAHAGSPLEVALPVALQKTDDRREMPQGYSPEVLLPDHPVLEGIGSNWPPMLFYNITKAKPSAEVVLGYEGDPILALHDYGKGRAAAFTPDAAPHGAPPEFLNWEYFNRFWVNLFDYLTRAKVGAK